MSARPIVFCFRNDLRLADNPGWRAAIESKHPVLACYVHDDSGPDQWRAGGASRWWLHHSLERLTNDIENLGGTLELLSGPWCETLLELATRTNAAGVYWSRGYEPWIADAQNALHEALGDTDLETRRFRGYLMFEPESVRTQSGGPYKVFTPFWKSCRKKDPPREPVPAPEEIQFFDHDAASLSLDDLELLPSSPDWAGGLRDTWTPGEEGAWARVDEFVQGPIQDYAQGRDRPAIHGTSMLSPHLHFGEVSPRQVWHAVMRACEGKESPGVTTFLSELGWREFSYHLLHHWPTLPHAPFREAFGKFGWRRDKAALKAWQKGQTGIPIVDAGMRQLWHTGWMHNRVRMIVASLLVKNMLIHWRDGEDWFWDTLVDADLASNAAGWQWVAGSGADAAPYFRIFNPVTQSARFDPEGAYLRRWVPEIGALPKKHIHDPTSAPAQVLKDADIALGTTYPRAIVDLKQTRQRALEAYQQIK